MHKSVSFLVRPSSKEVRTRWGTWMPTSSSLSSITILPFPRMPVELGSDVVPALYSDIGCLAVDLHAKLLKPLFRMEIGNGNLPPSGGFDYDRTSSIHDALELLQCGLVKQIIMINTETLVEHFNRPGAIVEHTIDIDKITKFTGRLPSDTGFIHCCT